MRPRSSLALVAAAASFFALAAPAQAGEEILQAVDYGADMTTYSCRTGELPIGQGQNVNDFAPTKTCPNALVVSGEGETDVFATGSTEQGYITRFKPSMVELLPSGRTVTPSVWDLHLHHIVWLKNFLNDNDGTPGQGPTFASGEEKTEVKMPEGYGIRTTGGARWFLNHMIHNLSAEGGREVYITWEIDWVPVNSTSGQGISDSTIRWLDVAGFPQAIYPVFDAEKGFDPRGDGKFTFPDDATKPNQPAFKEENEKIAPSVSWTVPEGGRTLVFGAGHLHPGGTSVDLQVARDLDSDGTAGDESSEIKPLFKSDAKYYEPAGPISWDVSLEATRPDWRISLEEGDVVSIDATYDVSEASWYESMGILPLAISEEDDPLAKDPFANKAAVRGMYDNGGILTHGRLKENKDTFAGDDFDLADPRKLRSGGKVPEAGLQINGFRYSQGGYSAFEGFPSSIMRPPLVKSGEDIVFTSMTAMMGMSNQEQIWHSITSCKAPCNKGSGIGYPLANGPLKFDSGQLGYGTGVSQDVTTGSNQWTLDGGLPKKGKTYTYFCRIHPFMRGSIRTKEENEKGKSRD